MKAIKERIGSEDAGYIEIERRGYLTSGEKSFVQQIQQQDSGTLKLISLSRDIASKKGLPLDKAYEALIEAISGNAKTKLISEIQNEFAEEIQVTLTGLANAKLKEALVHAVCLLIHRVDNTFDIHDIVEVHPDIIQGLSELYNDEENKSLEKLLKNKDANEANTTTKNAVDIEEIEKKQEKES